MKKKGGIETMAKKKAVTAFQMAKRICDRSDNIYNEKIVTRQVVTDILQMYMDECRKGIITCLYATKQEETRRIQS